MKNILLLFVLAPFFLSSCTVSVGGCIGCNEEIVPVSPCGTGYCEDIAYNGQTVCILSEDEAIYQNVQFWGVLVGIKQGPGNTTILTVQTCFGYIDLEPASPGGAMTIAVGNWGKGILTKINYNDDRTFAGAGAY